MTDIHVHQGGHEQTVAAPVMFRDNDPEWFWVEAQGGKGGFWSEDPLEAKQQRESGRVVLTAVDGCVEGVTGCAHRADVLRLTGRVWGLELTLGALLQNLGQLSGIGELAKDLPRGEDDMR